jgi:O-antigen/teichoic acid export membrane protein
MGAAISRFYYDYNDDKTKLNKLISTIFNSILFRGVIILLLAFAFGDRLVSLFSQTELQDFSSYGYYAIIIGISRAINNTVAALFRNERKLINFIILNISLGIIRIAFQLIGIFYIEMSFIGYVYGSCIGSGIIASTILIYIYYKSGFSFNIKLIKETHIFSSPLFFNAVCVIVFTQADKLFLENQPTELGIFFTATSLALGVQMIIHGLYGAAQPEVFKFMKAGITKQMNEIKQISNIIIMQTIAIVTFSIIPVMLYISYFYETDVRLASNLILILFIRHILKTQYYVFTWPLMFMKKTNLIFGINVIALVIYLALNFALVPTWGYYGIITSLFISDFIIVIISYYIQKRIIQIDWNLKKALLFPFGIVVTTVVLEIIKLRFEWNTFINPILFISMISISIVLLYKKELTKSISKFRLK